MVLYRTVMVAMALGPATLVAAPGPEPIDGAFGLEFGVSVPLAQLGATTLPPSDLPHRPFDDDYGDGASGWHRFSASMVPDPLNGAQFHVLTTEAGAPALMLARLAGVGCGDVYTWLIESLTRKYALREDTAVLPRPPYLKAAGFAVEDRRVDVGCGSDLVLVYTDTKAVARWQREQQAALDTRIKELNRLAEVQQRIARAQARELADSFTHGDKFRLDGGLGIIFGEPYLVSTPHPVDEPFPVRLRDLPAPFNGGTYQLTLDPEQVPIKLEGELPDPEARYFEQLTEALRAKYGSPIKDTARHRIFRINGNYFTLRQTGTKTDFALIDTRAQKAQEARAVAFAAAEVAAAEEKFRRETEGL